MSNREVLRKVSVSSGAPDKLLVAVLPSAGSYAVSPRAQFSTRQDVRLLPMIGRMITIGKVLIGVPWQRCEVCWPLDVWDSCTSPRTVDDARCGREKRNVGLLQPHE